MLHHLLHLSLLSSGVLVVGVEPESGGLVQRLILRREELVQPGLSYTNSSTMSLHTMGLEEVKGLATSSQVHSPSSARCSR